MGKLEGRVAIVTGGAGVIGTAYCKGFAAEGAAVVVADMADAIRVGCRAEGGRASGSGSESRYLGCRFD